MVIVKRLDTFLLQRFLPVLAMTFFICLFIVMMQFLWRFIEDLVGKGLSFGVVAELFGYAALTMVPTALPLAVLLASLMTFGNLGEKFELTAMKSAGISLFRIMSPLIILMTAIAIGAFFFQNNVLPIAQTKMWTLLLSMRQKSPEVEIPERMFYNDIPGMNLYVEKKNPNTGMLHNMIIYDVTRGMDNPRVILADSGKISFTYNRRHLFLHMYGGEMFENFQDNAMGFGNSGYMPFRRESFDDKQVYIAFDANFNRIDEAGMRAQYIGKNITELGQAIDSIQVKIDSAGYQTGTEIKTTPYLGLPYFVTQALNGKYKSVKRGNVRPARPINLDSVFNSPSPEMAKAYINQAIMRAKQRHMDYEFKGAMMDEELKLIRRHDIERQRKFTLSIACLIFFFIGAPLGAIIKKGGLGTPLVISVGLFVVYFIFDNMGYKMAKDGKMEVWEGIWLSSMVMLPMGIFFTYKAVGDSAVFEADAYKRHIRRLLRIDERLHIAMKEIVMDIPDPAVLLAEVQSYLATIQERRQALRKRNWLKRRFSSTFTAHMVDEYEELVNHLSYMPDKHVVSLLNKLPANPSRRSLSTVVRVLEEICQLLQNSINADNDSQIIDFTDSNT